MLLRRTSLVLFLCTTLLVSTGFAANRKKSPRRPSNWEGWIDLSLQNGGLRDAGSSVSSGGSIEDDIFNGGSEKWFVDYDNADGYVELVAEQNQPVPEPATLLVLIPGLLGLGYGLRRKLFT